jgi:hypothetical protein
MVSFIDSLVQSTNDKVEIKTQVNLSGESYRLLKFFKESISPKEVLTKIEYRLVSGDILVLGNSVSGILGTNKLGSSTETTMIWGNETTGIWGTNIWGTTLPSFTAYKILPYNDIFIERMNSNQLMSTLTNCSVSSKLLTFSSDGEVISECFYLNNNVTTATITIIFETETEGYTLYLSNNGLDWEEVTNATAHTFTSTGSSCYYKIDALNGTQIKQINVSINK